MPPGGPAGPVVAPRSQSTLSISPAIVEAGLDPGGSTSAVVTLSNPSPNTAVVTSTVGPFVAEETPNADAASRFDSSSWFRLEPASFLLAPGERRQVQLIITAPPTAEPGGHYATVRFQSPNPTNGSQSGSALTTNVGVLVLLTVRGDIRESIESVGRVSSPHIITDGGPTTFRVTLRNSGNVHVMPAGTLTVSRPRVFSTEIALPPGLLLPGTQRTYEVSWDHGYRIGEFNAQATVTAGVTRVSAEVPGRKVILVPRVILVPALVIALVIIGLGVTGVRRARRSASIRSNGKVSSQ